MSKSQAKRMAMSNTSEVLPIFLISLVLLPFWIILIVPSALIQLMVTSIAGLTKKKESSIVYKKESIDEVIKSCKVPSDVNSLRKYDMVLVGATGFTGKLVAQYLASQYGLKTFKWAIAGRRRDALEKIKSDLIEIDSSLKSLDIVIADTENVDSLGLLVSSTKVVLTTAGPFAKYGSNLVRYCAAYGTHYCDITGETDWVREMVDRYDDVARATGARIVSHCGHDCIPWDLLVFESSKQLKNKGDLISEIKIFDEIFVEISGGTVASAAYSITNRPKVQGDFDPLLKNSTGQKSPNKVVVNNAMGYGYATEHKSWIGPFIMAPVNADCVKRSNSINNYSPKLVYSEAQVYPSFLAAVTDGMLWFYLLSSLLCNPIYFLGTKVGLIKNPGEGPTVETMDKGFLRVIGYAKGVQGKTVKTTITFPTDPGYRDTARMLVESGLVLALSLDQVTAPGGVYTPAACQGTLLLDRLLATGSTIQYE